MNSVDHNSLEPIKISWIHISDPEWDAVNSNYVFDLQLFAAEDEGRTEPPSERKRRDEREKGNVPKSQELSSAIVLIAASIAMYVMGEYIFKKSAGIMRKYLEFARNPGEFTTESFGELLKNATWDIFTILSPILAVTFIFGIIGNVAQVGLLFAPRAIEFRFERLKPNFKRVLPTRQTLFNLSKSLMKVALIGWVSYMIITHDFLKLLLTGDMGLTQALAMVGYSGFKIFIIIGIILFIISIADFMYQKYEFEESLKQTPSEAKREIKEQVGDGALIARRRQLMRDMLSSNMLQSVPKADVVITNPIHFAVALSFNSGVDAAPRVVAKGEDQMALTIKEVAKKNGIPMVEDRLLAQQLYKMVDLNEEIPSNLYLAVSLVFKNLSKYQEFATRR
ncbi:EscU/YscU/HrcU family type III secretion system export apparatus switch protein [Leptospira sp. GIMC2001]|uniref:EscU/YscU/HrcU family type III secretion system export apparatus switch protein n=1 Tax=Leptospira sp. GIMC2001 TaxID=1513297 RepID=UPI0004A5C3BB|nr:EscU/YscU/HrcU family type III secretion system export apparatus switch protein [Leptospira sp. GIMC2001]AID56233.1 flagellar biosynthesis protein FlhB [Leptospira sp. GIMC2001]WCL48271.1 EscU/YscU/HrcU family type III secretion system export apparatus switch protein [Leptospira sp. GIMC2001]